MSTHNKTDEDLADFDALAHRWRILRQQLNRVIVGQDQTIDTLLTAILCQGHTLLVGVPGLAKTLLVRTLARSLNLHFKRIQFTPDLMPSDIIGTELIQQDPDTGQRSLKFTPGPLFTQLLLADEINRTPPKTQAALLEAMAERQVSAAGQTRSLDEPFLVVATQNPIEQEGTYPLPEAQLDRFIFSLWMDYPDKTAEKQIAAQAHRQAETPVDTVMTADNLLRDASLVQRMPVSDFVVDYAVTLARATRPDASDAPEIVRQYVRWGAGPRASQALIHAAKAAAAIASQPTPAIEHIHQVAPHVLRHRILLNYAAAGEAIPVTRIINAVLQAMPEG